MKLNNKGWGMMSFLIIIFLLLFVLLLIAYLANQYDNFPRDSRRYINYTEINKKLRNFI